MSQDNISHGSFLEALTQDSQEFHMKQLYKLKTVNQKQLILQAPTGGLRVVSLDGTTTQRTPKGYIVSTPLAAFPISSEDYNQINRVLR